MPSPHWKTFIIPVSKSIFRSKILAGSLLFSKMSQSAGQCCELNPFLRLTEVACSACWNSSQPFTSFQEARIWSGGDLSGVDLDYSGILKLYHRRWNSHLQQMKEHFVWYTEECNTMGIVAIFSILFSSTDRQTFYSSQEEWHWTDKWQTVENATRRSSLHPLLSACLHWYYRYQLSIHPSTSSQLLSFLLEKVEFFLMDQSCYH